MATATLADPAEFMDTQSFQKLSDSSEANTALEYMYRDASNWKAFGRVIFKGVLSRDDAALIIGARHEGEWFIPGQVGMEDLQEGWDPQNDHPFHEICGFSLTLESAEDDREIADIAKIFASTKWKKRYRP